MTRSILTALSLLVAGCVSLTAGDPPVDTASLRLADEHDVFWDSEWTSDVVYSPATGLLVSCGDQDGLVIRDGSGHRIAAIGSRGYASLAVVGSRLYAARNYPPLVEAWDLSTRGKLAEWAVAPPQGVPMFGGISSKGPAMARVCLAAAPRTGRLAVAYDSTVSILDAELRPVTHLERPRFSGGPGLQASENGRDVTDRYYRLQSVFWEPDEAGLMAFVSSRMCAFGWRWDAQNPAREPLAVSGVAGVAPGLNSRAFAPHTGGSAIAHPQWRGGAWVEDVAASQRVELRTVDLPGGDWGRELVRWSVDGSLAWRHVFVGPSASYRRFEVVGQRVLLVGGYRVEGGGRLATRTFDLATGDELD